LKTVPTVKIDSFFLPPSHLLTLSPSFFSHFRILAAA
jgi:hypothetical protein